MQPALYLVRVRMLTCPHSFLCRERVCGQITLTHKGARLAGRPAGVIDRARQILAICAHCQSPSTPGSMNPMSYLALRFSRTFVAVSTKR